MTNRTIQIGEICKLNEKSFSYNDKFDIVQYLDTGNITKNKISKLQIFQAKKEKIPSRAKRKVKVDTIIYSNVRPNQEHYGFLENPDENLVVSTGFTTINVIDANIDPKFIYYLITQKQITDYLHNIGTNAVSSYPSIKPEDIGNLKFNVPENIHYQHNIASILSALDAKIELNNKINTGLEAMITLLYNYWFVQFDFPNSNGKPYKSSGGKMILSEELKREIPERWKAGTASELFEFNPTLSIRKSEISSYIDMDALPIDGFMTKEIQKKKFTGGIKFQNGDLVIARITPCLENGKTGLITLLDENEIGFGSTEFIVIRGRNRSLSGFASLLARSELFRKFAITNMLGTSGRKRVDANALEKFKLAIPEDSIFDKFERITKSFFDRTTNNTQQNQQLIGLKDWLLPMLMNGQVTVSGI